MIRNMDPRLHKLLLELDNNEFITDKYFEWDELQKKQLTSDIVRFFLPIMRTNRENVLFGMMRCIEEAERIEDYEQADILTRCIKSLEKM